MGVFPSPLFHVPILLRISQGLSMTCKIKNTQTPPHACSGPSCSSGLLIAWQSFRPQDLDPCYTPPAPQYVQTWDVAWLSPAPPSRPSPRTTSSPQSVMCSGPLGHSEPTVSVLAGDPPGSLTRQVIGSACRHVAVFSRCLSVQGAVTHAEWIRTLSVGGRPRAIQRCLRSSKKCLLSPHCPPRKSSLLGC